ncbi:MAG TPA: GntR family transcriptional regulator, partial [Burkholderiales bacterium]|nr:GntR family transcriptional regulator [Burkholderiales bacterium]
MSSGIKRVSGLPLYRQLANQLEAQIAAGKFAPGSLLPSETDLASSYGVSVITVRGAMRLLSQNGLIARRPGKGTMVLERPRAVWELGWIDDLIAAALPSRVEVLAFGRVVAPIWVCERLGSSTTAKIHMMRTVRFATDDRREPFMSTELYYPENIGSVLHRSDFERELGQGRLAISVVERKCGLRIAQVRQTMGALI